MIGRIIAAALAPGLRAFAGKLVGAWVMAFVAASGGIWARRAHREPPYQPRKPWSTQRRRP